MELIASLVLLEVIEAIPKKSLLWFPASKFLWLPIIWPYPRAIVKSPAKRKKSHKTKKPILTIVSSCF